MPCFELSPPQQHTLLTLARESIAYGLQHGCALTVTSSAYEEPLQEMASCFVTLHLHGELKGCIGSLTAYQPLVADVVEHAYASAFRDSRFSPVTQADLPHLNIEISVISPQIEIPCHSEAELLSKLTPFKDGITIRDGFATATFLPTVWEQLPDKVQFLDHLRLKAGLARKHWSDQLTAYRYHTLSFSE
ncbi:AmmeMemoRadiSam system protein A [Litoribrevibacter euphylliae]|uniref:AmmeMemoRadiSam system protein A n=1 Tax=Litoribrevibacter euphylliae TaxID=1834034 RepID=A0ABV7H691_9GAMM